jgi:hypothetical protein
MGLKHEDRADTITAKEKEKKVRLHSSFARFRFDFLLPAVAETAPIRHSAQLSVSVGSRSSLLPTLLHSSIFHATLPLAIWLAFTLPHWSQCLRDLGERAGQVICVDTLRLGVREELFSPVGEQMKLQGEA